jgi:hypothetical protein
MMEKRNTGIKAITLKIPGERAKNLAIPKIC